MSEKPSIPKFESEAEEAEWWDRHREETARWVEEAVAAGKTATLSPPHLHAEYSEYGALVSSVLQ